MRGQKLRMRAGALAILAAATLVAACVPTAPRGTWAVPEAPCADLVLITARGSGERLASGETRSVRQRFREAAATLVPGLSLRVLELGDLDGNGRLDPGGYPAHFVDRMPGFDPAADPAEEPVLIGGYNESRRVGSAELVAVLTQLTTACPSARFVVTGMSQGADAVGQGLRQVPDRVLDRVDAVHLFGDPRFSVGPWMRAPDAQFPSGQGLLGARRPYVPPTIESRTASWCGEFDGLCTGQWPHSVLMLLPDCGELRQYAWCASRHTDYAYWAHGPAMYEAVTSAVGRAGWAGRS